MTSSSEDIIKAILQYQERLERYKLSKSEDKIQYVLGKLSKLPIRTSHLETTGVGRTVNALKKFGGEVGEAAKDLVISWKEMVLEEEKAAQETSMETEEDADSVYSSENENKDCEKDLSKETVSSRSESEGYDSKKEVPSRSDTQINSKSEKHKENGSRRKHKSDKSSEPSDSEEEHSSKHEKLRSKKQRYSSESSSEDRSGSKKSSKNDTRKRRNSSESDSDNRQSSKKNNHQDSKKRRNSSESDSDDRRSSKKSNQRDNRKGRNSSESDSDDRRSSKKSNQHDSRKRRKSSESDSDDRRSSKKSNQRDSRKRRNSSESDSDDRRSSKKSNQIDSKKRRNSSESDSEDVHSSKKSKREESPRNNHKHKSTKEEKERSDKKDKQTSSKYKESSQKHKSSTDKSKDNAEKSESKTKSNKEEESRHKPKKDSGEEKKHKSRKETEDSHSSHKSDKHKKHEEKEDSRSSHKSEKNKKHEEKSDKHSQSSHSSKHRDKESPSHSSKNSKEKEKKDKDKHESKKKEESKPKASYTEPKKSEHSKSKESNSSKYDLSEKKSKTKKDKEEVKKVNPRIIVNGIDSESGASFAEALGMCAPMVSSHKKKSSSDKKKESSGVDKFANDEYDPTKHKVKSKYDDGASTSSSSSSKVIVPGLLKEPTEPLNICLSNLLPEISPNYKPLGISLDTQHKRIITDDEALSRVMANKNQRTKVYSGNKTIGKVESLFQLCVRILQDNIDALEYTGGVPYLILKPIMERATPDQLFNLEHHNPYLIEDTDELWQLHCQKDFRTKRREEMESWRDMYMRCLDEREAKLNAVTATIKLSQDKSIPIRTTKLAYVETEYVKPPRNVARKQAKNGTVTTDRKTLPSQKVSALAKSGEAEKIAVPDPGKRASDRSSSSGSVSSAAMKPKKAPLMAKTLSFLKNRFKR